MLIVFSPTMMFFALSVLYEFRGMIWPHNGAIFGVFFISEFDGVASTELIFENLRTKVNQRWKLGLEFVALDIPQRKPLNAL